MRTHEAIRKAGTRVHEIVLAPLGLDDVARLVSDALHSKPERARPLAQLMQEKTGGNPFFVIQFFTVLAEEGLLAFDPDTADWTWNVARIQAMRYTDNVVDLMAGKLNRLPSSTQEALQQLACLGNVAEIATLTRVHGKSEAAIHAALWDAVRAGLVFRLKDAYTFLHDRVQEAAYALIPESERPAAHLRIGRALASRTAATELEEKIFEIVNQLDRGAALITAPEERVRVAELNLIAGKRAKISTAYASACLYFAAGMALLDERDWGSRYELMFSLWLERATCEFLTGDFDTAEQLIGELLERGSSNIDQAAAYHLKVQLHVVKSEAPQAVTCALACLHLFGIDIPAHPTREQV
jgi:predicted ATPase